MASKAYEIAFKLGAKMDKSYGGTFDKAESIAKKAVSGIKKTLIALSATVISFGAVKDTVDKAMAFESAMADVAKVVDGLKDETGKVTDAYAVMSDEILDMTARLPMAAEDITKLIAAAGQSGIAADELTRFSEDAAKMGVAFDLPAEKAGELAAVIRSSLGLTQDEFVTLADKINFFGNTTTQSADKLIEVVQATGLIGKQANVSADQIAAMGAAMNGMDADNMGTALSNIYGSLMTGSGATSAAASAWESLGFTSEQVAKDMLADSEGTMIKIFDAMKKLPQDQLASTTAAIFGNNKSTKMAIASFTENLDALKQNFQSIGDAEKYAGSMQNEFNTRAGTTENTIQLAKNAIDRLKISLGTLLLPVVAKGAALFANALTSVTEKIPQLIDNVKGLADGIKNSLNLDETFANLKPKLPAIKESAKFFAANFVSGIGQFLDGESLSTALIKSMSGAQGVLQQVLGSGNGDMAFGVLQNSLERISGFIDVIRTNVGEVTAAFKNSFSGISESLGPVIDSIMGAFKGVQSTELSVFSSILGGIKDALILAAPAIATFVTMLMGAAGDIIPVITQICGAVVQAIDMIVPVLVGIFGEIMNNAGFIIDGLKAFIDAFVPVISGVIETVMGFLPRITPVFEQIGTVVGGLVKTIGETITFLAPLFSQVFDFICQNILPVAMTVFETLGSVISTVVGVISNVLPIIANVLMTVWQAIHPILQLLMDFFKVAFDFIANAVSVAFSFIGGLIENIMQIFQGIIDFVVGVFTGNWGQAWDGIVSIFKGIVNLIPTIFEGIINAVIGIINGITGGINIVTGLVGIPAIPQIPNVELPRFEKGTENSPDTFIAGERGPELITGAPGRKVFTAAETESLFNNLLRLPDMLIGKMTYALNEFFKSPGNFSRYSNLESPGEFIQPLAAQSSSTYNSPVELNYSPHIQVGGGQDSEQILVLIDGLLKEQAKGFEQIIKDVIAGMQYRKELLSNE